MSSSYPSEDTKQSGVSVLQLAEADSGGHHSGVLQVTDAPRSSTSSASVPPSPRNKGGSLDGASPTPSIASFSSIHTPVRSKKRTPRKKKGAPAAADEELLHPPHPAGVGGGVDGASAGVKQQDKHNKGRSYSPNVLKRFQAVKSGISFVNHLKFGQ
jgi:hypothetical protein